MRIPAVFLIAAALLAQPAAAQDSEQLAALVNGYRAAPGVCEGHSGEAAPPLTLEPVLSAIRLGQGAIIEAELERAGYAAASKG